MSSTPLVSIIVTSYNYARFIGQTIRSVLGQSYPELELIIWDDCSTDDSLDVIRSFSDDRIRVIASRENCGPYAAYNQAALLCRGAYLGTIDSDDWIAAERIEKQVKYLEDHPDVDVLATFVVEVDTNGHPVGDSGRYQGWFNQALDFNRPENWICENHLCHSSVLMRRALRDRIGPHNPSIITAADYEYWVRCLLGGARFHILQDKVTYYRAHGSNISMTRQLRGCVELAYIYDLFKQLLFRTNRSDLHEEGVRRVGDWCYMDGLGVVLAEMIREAPQSTDLHLTFEQFLQEYNMRAAQIPGATSTK